MSDPEQLPDPPAQAPDAAPPSPGTPPRPPRRRPARRAPPAAAPALAQPPSHPHATAARDVPEGADLDHPGLYFNVELGSLDFNWRVLHQARDSRVPLLERVRFLAITASNLDELFQKRVGGLRRQEAVGIVSLSRDGRTPGDQLRLIGESARVMHRALTETWENELTPLLRREGVVLSSYGELAPEQQEALNVHFRDHVYPVLTPLAVDPGHPFPFISNLSLSLAILMRHAARNTLHFARLKVPTGQGRWLAVPRSSARFHYVPLEQVIQANVSALFPGMEIVSVDPFRVTRSADVTRDDEGVEDLVSMISEELRERRFAPVVRLEVDAQMPGQVRQLLMRELEIHAEDVYVTRGMIALSDCAEMADLDVPALRYDPWEPVVPEAFSHEGETEEEQDIFSILRRGDILVHHPYESFGASVVRLVEEAANDPDVVAIKQTLYRTDTTSPVAAALLRAAERGKQVAVLVEVTARFDEAKNIEWAQRLEDAGVHVTYGLVGLKTHSKVTLIVRYERGRPWTYCHIGTGNYHVRTARLYADLGLLTCNPDVGGDLVNLFHFLTGYAPDQTYRRLLVAPRDMRRVFEELIRREVQHQRDSGTGRIIAKMNALDDPAIIKELYRASQAGVRIDLVVRGHSRLRPGLAGYSENIRVLSIVGRFLEHDRIYYFHNAGEPDVFIGSADWRQRNLSERVEALVPVTDPLLQERLIRILGYALEDNRLAWDLQPDGSYVQRRPRRGEPERNYQEALMRDAQERASATGRPWEVQAL